MEQQVSHFHLFTFRHFSSHSPPPLTPSLLRLRQTLLPTGGPLTAASFSVGLSPCASAFCTLPCWSVSPPLPTVCYCRALCPGPASTSFILPTLPTVRLYEAVTLLYVPAISCQGLMHASLCVIAAMCVRVRV